MRAHVTNTLTDSRIFLQSLDRVNGMDTMISARFVGTQFLSLALNALNSVRFVKRESQKMIHIDRDWEANFLSRMPNMCATMNFSSIAEGERSRVIWNKERDKNQTKDRNQSWESLVAGAIGMKALIYLPNYREYF